MFGIIYIKNSGVILLECVQICLRRFTLVFMLLFSLLAGAQEDDLLIDPMQIRLKARLISAADSSAVPYANIINNRTHSGTISNNDGYFNLEMLNIDSLIVTSVGFESSVLKVPYNYSEYTTLVFVLNPVNYPVGEVEVTGERPKVDLGLETGKPIDLDPKLRGDAYNEAPPILAAFFNPASYWQYYLSKRERRKRELRKTIALDRNWELHSQNYNKEKVMMLTGLNEMQADTFMLWFNNQDVLPYTSTEYEIRASIKEYFQYYKIEKAMGK